MAPGSKRGSKVGSNNSELRLGDLVLAKIKGYPAWPAKIGRPEDWKHAPDPKKYFVQFFGTKEIAFIAPADIQAFTNEAKSKVSARCQGKKVKYFAKAVKEICEEFEALQKNNLNGVRDKAPDLSSIHTADSLGNEVPGGDEDDKIGKEGSEVKLELNNSTRMDSVRLDLRDCSSDDKDHPLPPHLSSEKVNELSLNPAKPVKKDSVKVSSYSPVNTEALHDGKVKAGSSDIRSKESTIRDKPKLGQGLKRKQEATMRKTSGSQEHSRDGKQTNFVPCSNVAGFSMDGIVLGLAAVSRDDYTKLMKKKAGSDARANARKDAKGKDEEPHNKVIPKKRKNPLRGHEKGDSKASSPSRASKHTNSSAKEPGHSNDEDALRQAKRHRKEQDKTYSPSSLQENEIGNLAAAAQKNGLLHPDQGPSSMLQLPKKRRAVRLCDDERPKTPVHGGIANKVSSIPRVSDSKKQTVVRGTLLELPSKNSSKAPKIVPQKKVAEGANRDFLTTSDRSSSLKQSNNEKRISTFSGAEKTTLKADTLAGDASVPRNSDEKVASSGVRLDGDKNIKKHIPAEYRHSESNVSMKNLIAAAQERKRLDSLQNSSRKLSPGLKTPFQSSSTLQVDELPSPSFDIDEFEERRMSSGHQAFGSTLSSSTDAVVARDAFEGMIETLSRTKESIGRATRHAIDCTKYGIANEIVDLLIRKMENELNPRRRVVMFFLVDSITQCSHSQKGIAGASYIPCVEAALPRLIAAAAPPGKSALENRRQCHKVLRLWLERKILPENAIRRQMDHIEAANDGDDKTSLLLPNRQSRTERSFDDPVLEMEGMLDEYGSNATFQLPGLMMSNMFDDEEEEEDGPNPLETLANEVAHASPSEQTPASRDNSNYTATPNERRHCILEDVDGELEMEDDSVHHKEKALLLNASTSVASKLELVSPEGSPQFPLDTPPETPPLPSSPHPLSLPPTLPPRYSPDLPLPPPPPPPAASSQHRLYHPLPPPYLPQPQGPPQIATISQQRPPLPNSQPIPYPSPLPHEVSNMPNGTQLYATPIEAPVNGEVLSHQQAPFLVPPPVSSAHERMVYATSRPMEYGQGGSYVAPQQRPSYTPVGVPFVHRPVRIEPPPQRAVDHFTYLNAAPRHQHPPPYALPNIPNGPRRFVSDDQWRTQGNEGWISGAGPGHFGTTQERPMGAAAANFHYPAANVHGVPMLPSRPDMSNYHWR